MPLLPWRRIHTGAPAETVRVATAQRDRTPSTVATVTPLPPSVARVAERTRLSAQLLSATLEVEQRSRVTLDDIERADALAARLLARRAAPLSQPA